MTDTVIRLMQVVLAGTLFLGNATLPSSVPAAPASSQEVAVNPMPLQPGRTLTYQTDNGSRFALTFEQPVTVRWFDGTDRLLVPALDTQCACRVLFRQVDGEIRVVGTVRDGRMEQWGEYIVVRFVPEGGTARGTDVVRVEVTGT